LTRSEGLTGPVTVRAYGADSRFADDGVAGRISSRLEFVAVDGHSWVVDSVNQGGPELIALTGLALTSGFKRTWRAALPSVAQESGLLAAILDEIPGLAATAAFAQIHGGVGEDRRRDGGLVALVGACAGWTPGGDLATRSQRHLEREILAYGPPVGRGYDDLARWHREMPLVAFGLRRRRRIDVQPPQSANSPTLVRADHVDTFAPPGDGERILHQWDLEVQVNPDTSIALLVPSPRVLPGEECPTAVASARGLVGQRLGGLADAARALPAAIACTHLNSAYVAIGHAQAMIIDLQRNASP
jgi:hypothetical protein